MHTAAVVNPLGLEIHDGDQYLPRHGVTDPEHRDALAADMAAHGWNGAPVVGHTDWARAITGSHRIAAAEQAGITVPVVDIYDLADACGIDLEQFAAPYVDLEDALPAFCAALPAEVADAYGLDIE